MISPAAMSPDEQHQPLRVALADDSALFRHGLALLLQSTGAEIVAETSTGEALLRLASRIPIDVAILDIRMPPTNTDEGLQTARRLRALNPRIAILVLSTYAETAYATELLDLPTTTAGVGYLLKDRVSDITTLHDAMERLRLGEALIDPGIAAQLIVGRRKLEVLSDQEKNVLQAMAEGRSNAGIAKKLHLSTRTVEDYCAKIFTKLDIPASPDANRRVNAVLQFLRNPQ